MDRDTMFTFFDAWFLAQEGEDPTKTIENQEKRGQQNIIRGMRLPKKTNEHTVPLEIRFRDVSNNMSYDERREIVDHNIYEYTKEQYEKMGIEVGRDYDDLFWSVSLPEGWEIKATDHTMWNELMDNKGRKRASFFYKAAFYDRDAFINFETRFHLDVTHTADPSEDFDIWKKSDLQGTVKDGDIIIFQTKCVPAVEDYHKEDKIKDKLWAELEAFMNEHWPDYKNIHAYWND